jgi:hypothetical protein
MVLCTMVVRFLLSAKDNFIVWVPLHQDGIKADDVKYITNEFKWGFDDVNLVAST